MLKGQRFTGYNQAEDSGREVCWANMHICIRIKLAALIIAASALCGCAPKTAPEPEPVTVVTEETPASAASAEPEQSEPDGYVSQYVSLPMHETYEEALSHNSDVIGWITIDGTVIDYPVVRTGDNNFYLTHDADGNESAYGAIFMDYRNANAHMQKHIIIYGHNMKNGTMFHDLVNYKQQSFFAEHNSIYLLWDGTDTEWEIFCAYIVEPNTIYPIYTLFDSDEAFARSMNDTIKYAKTVKPSCVDDGVTIQPSDQVLSLITCTYEYDDSRFVVMARRVK